MPGRFCVARASGSSPRMRGAHDLLVHHGPGPGIIPAYAGSTSGPRDRTWPQRDHPRVCGEHKMPSGTRTPGVGSSPRMRGAPRNRRQRQSTAGIIPAYAGSTPGRHPTPAPTGDHPRVCGEHKASIFRKDDPKGSSPRMRGARRDRRVGRWCPGIIPAYAGSTIDGDDDD